jgi:hypothetical protein
MRTFSLRELHGATVLHCDADYDRIAASPGSRWNG